MIDEPEEVDAEPETPAMADAEPAIRDFLPDSTELTIGTPDDMHSVALVMDAHDIEMLLTRVQSSALTKWVYQLPDGKMGLSIDGVQDITQLINWTGKARLTVDPATLHVERIIEDVGNGPETLVVARIFARDDLTGQMWPGVSTEPLKLKLRADTAADWRRKGKVVPEDGRVFDVYAETKAIGKATRNALDALIPEELKATIIAMYANDPLRVQRISTPEQAKAEELPTPLNTPEALALAAECDELYDQVKAVGPEARVRFTPAQYHAWMVRSQHDLGRLAAFRDHLVQRLEEIPVEIENDRVAKEARDTVLEAKCPNCGQGKGWRCKQLDGAGVAVLRDGKPVLVNQPHVERLQARVAELRS